MFKKINLLFISLAIILGFVFSSNNVFAEEKNTVNIYFFHRIGCAHCAKMDDFLLELKDEYDNIDIIKFDVEQDNNLSLLEEVGQAFNQTQVTTPFVALGGKSYVGHNSNIEFYIEKYVEKYSYQEQKDIVYHILNDLPFSQEDLDNSVDLEYNIPLLGVVNIQNVSIALLAILIGFIDGFNPCAMWVLIFLISLLINNKNKKRLWILGTTFLLTSAFFYFLMMISWLEVIKLVSAKFWFQLLVGLFAVGAGSFNLSRYIKSLKTKDIGCEVVDEGQKRKMFARISKIVNEQKFLIAFVGIILLAISVNFIEIACSAGLPVLFTQVLSINNIVGIDAVLYILLYVLFFLIDDLIIFAIAIFAFRLTGITNKYSNLSHLIGGLVMILIGILLIFFPSIIMFSF